MFRPSPETTLETTTISPTDARRLATQVELISQDLLVPLDITPRIVGDDVTRFRLHLVCGDSHASTAPDIPRAAQAIAQEITVWSNRLKMVSEAIRERYPLKGQDQFS